LKVLCFAQSMESPKADVDSRIGLTPGNIQEKEKEYRETPKRSYGTVFEGGPSQKLVPLRLVSQFAPIPTDDNPKSSSPLPWHTIFVSSSGPLTMSFVRGARIGDTREATQSSTSRFHRNNYIGSAANTQDLGPEAG
jgi:hypothetical protein